MSDEVILLCKTVKSGPAEALESKKEICNFCGDEVWVSATGMKHVEDTSKEYKFMCLACALKHNAVDQGQIMECSNEQIEEIASVMGCDLEEAKKCVDNTAKMFKQANAYKNN